MAEAPAFGGFHNSDSADTFAKVIAQIKSDMAAIERSAKNIEISLSKSSRSKLGGGGSSFGAQNSGGATGFAKPTMASSLGSITSQLGGVKAVATAGAFGVGAAMGGLPGGIAAAGLPDLIMRPERALNMEAARFGMRQATGDYGSFKNMMDGARNDFNVQNEQAFMNTMVYGTQRAGMVSLNGGGTIGERRAAAQIGGYNTVAGLAGIDQSAVPGVMQSMMGAPAFYAGMAANVQTRDPVTGATIGIEGQANQLYNTGNFKSLDDLNRHYAIGSTGYAQLMEMYGGNADAADSMVEAMRVRAQNGGKPLKEGQVQDQAKDAGILGGPNSQGMEATRKLESAKMNMGEEYLNDATKGIKEAADEITKAVDLLAELEGPLRGLVGKYTEIANAAGVTATELPTATKGITDFLSGLPGLLLQALGLKGLLGGKGGGGSLLSKGASLLKSPVGKVLGPAAAAVGVGLSAKSTYDAGKEGDGGNALWGAAGTVASGAAMGFMVGGPVGAGIGAAAGGLIAGGSWLWGQHTKNQGGRAKGDWFVEADQDDRIHYGEMVIPNRIATAVRQELAVGKTSGSRATERGNGGSTVNIYLTVQKASDQEAMALADRVKKIIDGDREMLSIGSGRFGYA